MSGRDGILVEQLTCSLSDSDLPGLGLPERCGITDIYRLEDYTLVVATDRAESSHARLGTVPFKGEVVTRMATWWLDVTSDLTPSAVERLVDPQALLIRRTQPVSIGFAAHTRLTGRLARAYADGLRQFGPVRLADGLAKGASLPETVFVPILRDRGDFGSVPISRGEALTAAGMNEPLFDRTADLAAKLFARGQERARQRKLELVDTLYGFGLLGKNELVADVLLHSPHLSTYCAPTDGGSRDLSESSLVASSSGTGGAIRDELRLEVARTYLDLGRCFVTDFEPHAGPVKNRLALSLSFVGLLA